MEEVGDYEYLKVLPMRGLCCFKVRGKLTPGFIDPFKITEHTKEELKAEFWNVTKIH
jgi:hypothetical protein